MTVGLGLVFIVLLAGAPAIVTYLCCREQPIGGLEEGERASVRLPYAPLSRRWMAGLIDAALTVPLGLAVHRMLAGVGIVPDTQDLRAYMAHGSQFAGSISDPVTRAAVETMSYPSRLLDAALYAALIAVLTFLVVTLTACVYGALMESSLQRATLGKLALGIYVADTNGERVSLLRAVGRNTSKVTSALPLFFGFLVAIGSARHQTLHDVVSECVVLRRSTAPKAGGQSARAAESVATASASS